MAQAQYIKAIDELPKEHALVWVRINGCRPRKMYRIGRYFWYCNKELSRNGNFSSIGDNVIWRYCNNKVMKTNEAPEKIYVRVKHGKVFDTWNNIWIGVNDIEYTRTDAFIEKAVRFIKDNIELDRYNSPDEESYRMGCAVDYFETNMFIEDFKKYMKGE